ncbi:MAG: DUF4349 domain-containing protein [Solirubrobacterales bacterium]
MESHRNQPDLVAELRAMRPTPRAAFVTELDARVAAGFPPTSQHPSSSGRISKLVPPLGRLAKRVKLAPRRRLLAPAGAVAVAAIAVATGVVVTSEGGPAGTALDARFGASGTDTLKPMTRRVAPALATPPSSASGHESSGVQFSEAPVGVPADGSASAPTEIENQRRPGPYAAGVAHRDVERSAQIVLGADPADVRGDAAKVFETVHAFRGIVLRSSISDGGEGEAGATFNLLVPSGKLGDAMAAFSGIAEVRSRHESALDVTAPTISLGERLQDARAKVESLLAEVAAAETEGERELAEAKLRSARRHVATLRTQLTNLQRRTHLSSVWLRIETGAAMTGGDSGSWGIGNALHDAGHILAVAAGVTVIGLAILAPLALICLLTWLVRRTWIRRSRERALG